MNLDAFDEVVRRKRKKKPFQSQTSQPTQVFPPALSTQAPPSPWEEVLMSSDVGLLPSLDRLKAHSDHLLAHHNRLEQDRAEYLQRHARGELPPGHGKYAAQYEQKLDEIGADWLLREDQAWLAETYSKAALLNAYGLARGSHPRRHYLLPQSHYRSADTNQAVLAQVLTDQLGLSLDEVTGHITPPHHHAS